jgi:prefoldin subunit 5
MSEIKTLIYRLDKLEKTIKEMQDEIDENRQHILDLERKS